MYVRRVKRKCSVRGCKGIDCFAISRTREIGNTVIICKECLNDALEATNRLAPDGKTNVPKTTGSAAPPLFFHAGVEQQPKRKTPETRQKNTQKSKEC